MIVDLIDKLIDRVIELVKEHKQVQRSMFDNFVEPIYSLLESVHEEYLKCFRAYRATIESAPTFTTVVDGLCSTIKQDNLFTEHNRAKLRTLTEIQDDVTDNNVLRQFVGGVWFYLYGGATAIHGSEGMGEDIRESVQSQMYRNSLFNSLREITRKPGMSDEERKREALDSLDQIVLGMQVNEGYITRLFMKLKVQCVK